MPCCLAEVQYGGIKVESPSKARNIRTPENPRSLPNTKGSPEAKDGTKRTHPILSHATRFLRRSLSVGLSFLIWLFLADFLFQFTHVHRDGNSLAGIVHALVSLLQAPVERVLGFDARYQFPVSNLDFMPFIIFVVLLIFRNRADSLIAGAERLIRGEKLKKSLPLYRSHSSNASGLALNNPPPKVREPGGDDHLSLRTKVQAIYSE